MIFWINKWYQSFALRNFDLEDMEFETTHSNTTAKLPILKLGEYEMWVIRIKQYFQIQDYALWEGGENYVPVTAEEKANKKNDVKASVTPSNLSMQRNIEYPKALHYWVNSTRSENDY
ncbi:hypothetical protein Tco_0691447 [Tanacetum coccineum]